MFQILLAQTTNLKNTFGTVNAPAWMGRDATPEITLTRLFNKGINIFLLFAGFAMLAYLFWGAFDWITSGGEKEKIARAQGKITNALIGMILTVVVLVVFGIVAGDILGIVTKTPDGGWSFQLPTLGGGAQNVPSGGVNDPNAN